MTDLVSKFKDTLQKRRQYNRTVAEIEALSPDEAADLGIFREDARTIAEQAVYGKPATDARPALH